MMEAVRITILVDDAVWKSGCGNNTLISPQDKPLCHSPR